MLARRTPRLALLVCVLSSALAGCGGLAFRAVHRVPPRVPLTDARVLWVATDVTDALSQRVAERIARSLATECATRVVPVGRPPEDGVVVLTIALRRSLSHRPATVMQNEWQCDPTGACFPRQMPRVIDLPVVRLLARVSVHDGDGRVLEAPRVLDVSETGEDEMGAELRLVGRLQRDIESTFRAVDEAITLAVESLADRAMQDVLEEAIETPSVTRCAALEDRAAYVADRPERARVLHASGSCHVAVALSADEPDVAELRRAEQLLLSAVRLRPVQRYALAVAEVRRILARLRVRAEVPTGEPSIPEGYR